MTAGSHFFLSHGWFRGPTHSSGRTRANETKGARRDGDDGGGGMIPSAELFQFWDTGIRDTPEFQDVSSVSPSDPNRSGHFCFEPLHVGVHGEPKLTFIVDLPIKNG